MHHFVLLILLLLLPYCIAGHGDIYNSFYNTQLRLLAVHGGTIDSIKSTTKLCLYRRPMRRETHHTTMESTTEGTDHAQPKSPYSGIFAVKPPSPDTADIEADGGRWVRLDDGRIVEYFVFGSDQTDATIIVDCPGGGCSGTLIGRLPNVVEWCREKNVRAISPSYPGFGRSTVQPGWNIADWPRTDLEPILKKEEVTGPFLVTGVSFGSPHAQAVAVYFGSDRVKALGMRVPYIGRSVSEEEGLPLGQADMRFTSKSANTTLFGHITGKAFMAMCSNPAGFLDEPTGIKRIFIKSLQQNMLTVLRKMNQEYPNEMKCVKEEMERGVISTGQGWLYMGATDTLLDHGFDVRQIKDTPLVVWYADDDEDCPPSHGVWLVEIFKAKSRVFSGLGHVGAAFLDHTKFLEEVLEAAS